MLTDGDGLGVPADGGLAARRRDGEGGAGDHVPLGRFLHLRLALPAPAVGGDLVAAVERVACEPGAPLDRASRAAEGGLDPVAIEKAGDAPVPGPGSILEVGSHAEVGNSLDDLRDLVDGLVPLVAVADEELRAFLRVDDERDGETRLVRPLRVERITAITFEIALRVHSKSVSGARRGPCRRTGRGGPIMAQGGRKRPSREQPCRCENLTDSRREGVKVAVLARRTRVRWRRHT